MKKEPKKTPTPKKTPARKKKPAAPEKATAAAKKAPAPAKKGPAAGEAPLIHRLRVSLVSGPWTDGEECVRYIDFPAGACLYDVHEAIQEAIEFDNEHPFYFFEADADGSDRQSVPPQIGTEPDRKTLDCDIYEEIKASECVPDSAGRALFYAYMSEGGEWVFQIELAGSSPTAQFPVSSYPLQIDSLSCGPNPTQYGHDFDDYAEEEDAFQPRRHRGVEEGWDDGDEMLFDEEEDDPFGGGDEDADPNW